jgi:deoxyribonuclease-4
LKERAAEVEAGTEEEFSRRRELVKLLVESIIAERGEVGKTRLEITYRFGPPDGPDPSGEDRRHREHNDVAGISNPQGWTEPTPRPDADLLVEGAREAGLCPVVVHAKYLMNLASQLPEHRERLARALASELAAAGAIGADVVVVHSGSHGGDGEEEGMERLVESLKWARDLAGPDAAEPVVENSVGAGTWLCSTFEGQARAAEGAEVRACVDTALAFVVGYDLSTPKGAAAVGGQLRGLLGDRIALLHLNDTKNGHGSHRDGHARIGEGQVSEEACREFFAVMDGVPAVTETPYATPAAAAEQVRLLKRLAGGLPLRVGGV